MGFFDAVRALEDAAEIEQHGFAIGKQAPGCQVMLGGEFELVALLGKLGQFMMGAEIAGIQFEGFFPALDAGSQRGIDILECLFGGSTGGGIAGLADPVEDPAGLHLLFCFVAEKRILEGNVDVIVVQTHGLPELVAGGFAFTDFEQRVGKVLANGRSSGSGFDRFLEESNGFVVIPGSEKLVGFGQRGVGRIGAGCWSLRACKRAEQEDWDYEPHSMYCFGEIVRRGGEVRREMFGPRMGCCANELSRIACPLQHVPEASIFRFLQHELVDPLERERTGLRRRRAFNNRAFFTLRSAWR